MDNPQHCLIVEDHAQAREWLKQALHKAFSLNVADVRAVATIAEGKRAIEQQVPDLALIDLGLPDGSGITLIRVLDEFRAMQGKSTTIIVSTVMNDDESIFTAIRSGADGYLLKEETLENLVGMLQGIREDKPPLSPAIAMRLLTHFRAKPEDDLLAPRERQVLQLLAKGFTVQRVADMLGITHNTASGYVKDIYRKLNVNSRAEATLEASKRGLV